MAKKQTAAGSTEDRANGKLTDTSQFKSFFLACLLIGQTRQKNSKIHILDKWSGGFPKSAVFTPETACENFPSQYLTHRFV